MIPLSGDFRNYHVSGGVRGKMSGSRISVNIAGRFFGMRPPGPVGFFGKAKPESAKSTKPHPVAAKIIPLAG